MEPAAPSNESTQKAPLGLVSAKFKCITDNANQLCIYDAFVKLKTSSEYDIGGTYAATTSQPELWFYYTTSLCPGGHKLLNLFVCHRLTGTFTINISDSSNLTKREAPDNYDETTHWQLPNAMETYTFKSSKRDHHYFIRSYWFNKLPSSEDDQRGSTLCIPIKITVNPRLTISKRVLKSIKLQHDLSGLLKKQETTDFVLESGSHTKFPTHKILLVAHSPVLRDMIKKNNANSMFIDISDEDMKLLLEFIYTGTIKDILKQNCSNLLEIADRFQLSHLFELTQHIIGDQLTVDNAIDLAMIAKKYKLDELQKKVFTYIANTPKVLETDAWNNLTDVELTKYLFRFSRSLKD